MTAPVPGEAPGPTRPDSVRLAIQLWIGVIVCQLIGTVATYPMMRDVADDMAADLAEQQPDAPEVDPSVMAILAIALFAVVATALAVVFMVAAWQGRNWGRQGLGVLSAFLVVRLVFDVFSMFIDTAETGVPAWAMIFQILGGVAAIGALVALMNADTAAYCRDMGLWRQQKKFNGGVR